jgi:hypothetical protein
MGISPRRYIEIGLAPTARPLFKNGDNKYQSAVDTVHVITSVDQCVSECGRGLHSSTLQLNVSTFCPMWWGALLVSVTETAQVEQRYGRVQAPGVRRARRVPHARVRVRRGVGRNVVGRCS